MNDAELAHVVADLQRLVGAPFEGAWQPRRDRILLGIGGTHLLLVPRGPHARIHTVVGRPANPKRPFSFQGALRAHLGGRVVAIEKRPDDRVVDVRFEWGALHLRLTGRSGGLWLLGPDGVTAAYDGPAPAALPSLPSPPPREVRPRFSPREGETWDDAARRWFSAEESRIALTERRRRVHRGLKRALDRNRRLHTKLEEDLTRAARAPEVRRQADTLAASLHTVPRSADQIALPDLEDPDHTHWIALDPSKSPAANLEVLYGRARRLDRMGDHVIERLDEVEHLLVELERGLADVDAADHARLDALERLIPPERGRRAESASLPWITWTGPRGERVLVGRNAAGNRRLTFQRARGDDFWLHIRSKPGAHVVIPCRRGHPPPLELLLAAAQIALHHGKVARGSHADVQYTRVRHVRSIPGEGPGRVRVDQEKVLHVVREPDLLAGWTHD